MVAVIKPEIGGASATNSTSVADASPATERIKKFFEDKDWKFYAAVLAGVAVAGAGAYYLTSGSSSKKQKKPASKKSPEGSSAKGKETAGTKLDVSPMLLYLE
jgi:import receptor subunit TOM70